VSADLRRHPVGYFLEPVLAAHDKSQVEVFCYSNSPKADEVTKRLQSHVQTWRQINDVSDETVVKQIRADGVDILVDLSGHTKGHRLRVFARKPAPIQITWMGYVNTTGMETMDYI